MRLMLSTTLTAVMGAALQPPSLLARYLRLCPHYFLLPQHAFGGTFTKSATKTTKRATTRDYVDRNIPGVFDVAYDAYGRDGCNINACHRCLFDIQMRSYPRYFLLPQHAFGGTFTEKATKPAKRAINRDLTDRNLPDVFDVVYDTYGRDGFSNRLSSLLARYTDALASSLFFVP